MPLASTSAIHCWTISSDQVEPVPSIWAYVVRSRQLLAPVGGGDAREREQAGRRQEDEQGTNAVHNDSWVVAG